MIYPFILIILFIAIFVKLGMYSVWVTILSGTLKISMFVIAALAITLIWRKFLGK